MSDRRNACRILVEKPKVKRPLGRPRHRCVNNIKIDLREIGWSGMECVHLAQDKDQWRTLVNMVLNLWVPQNVQKFLSSCTAYIYNYICMSSVIACQSVSQSVRERESASVSTYNNMRITEYISRHLI
jgi:hypothetical protein